MTTKFGGGPASNLCMEVRSSRTGRTTEAQSIPGPTDWELVYQREDLPSPFRATSPCRAPGRRVGSILLESNTHLSRVLVVPPRYPHHRGTVLRHQPHCVRGASGEGGWAADKPGGACGWWVVALLTGFSICEYRSWPTPRRGPLETLDGAKLPKSIRQRPEQTGSQTEWSDETPRANEPGAEGC